jgi:hypothetical protein
MRRPIKSQRKALGLLQLEIERKSSIRKGVSLAVNKALQITFTRVIVVQSTRQ